MFGMFTYAGYGGGLFELNVSKWDTSNVTDMTYLFHYCKNVKELDVSNWDTSNVTNMAGMFEYAGYTYSNFTLNVSKFDTSKVTSMNGMFSYTGYNSDIFELDVSGFDTSNVIYMGSMFCYAGYYSPNFILDVSNFDTSNVTNMAEMFLGAGYSNPDFTLNVSNFDTSKVTNMANMFAESGIMNSNYALDVTNFDTSNVTNMKGMFACTNIKEIDLSNFDTSNVTIMGGHLGGNNAGGYRYDYGMFYHCYYLRTINLSSFDTSNVTTMAGMFESVGQYNATPIEIIFGENFDTSNVTDMYAMFSRTNVTELNLNFFNTSKVTNMWSMFYRTGYNNLNLTLNLSSFDTSNVEDMEWMFASHKNLKIIFGENFDTPKITNMSGIFSNILKLEVENYKGFNTSNVVTFNTYWAGQQSVEGMFEYCQNLNIDFDILTTADNIADSKYYNRIFRNAAIVTGSEIRVNYTSENEALVDAIIATKSDNSNVVKGTKLTDYTITLDNNLESDVDLNSSTGYKGKEIVLSSVDENKRIKSFKLDGVEIIGNTFIMTNKNVTISDVTFIDIIIVESQHNDYLNNEDYTIYYENTFEGATSITVELTYQTESTSYDWVYLYTDEDTIYQNKKYGNTTLTTETITIPSNYLKIVFRTDSSVCNYYGFKAIIIPNYD